jgi:hypothetical protein
MDRVIWSIDWSVFISCFSLSKYNGNILNHQLFNYIILGQSLNSHFLYKTNHKVQKSLLFSLFHQQCKTLTKLVIPNHPVYRDLRNPKWFPSPATIKTINCQRITQPNWNLLVSHFLIFQFASTIYLILK